jgi:hypothetical protein
MDLKELYLKKSQFTTRLVGNELILVPLKSKVIDMNELFTLNEVGCFIWEHINEHNSENDIVKAVISEFEVNDNIARMDVANFLVRLKVLLFKCEID